MAWRLFSIIGVLFVLLLSGPINAQSSDDGVAVQLKSIGLPAISEKGYRGRTTVTPYIVVQSEDVISRFCGRWPRVVDAILIAFEEAPVILKDKNEDLAARQDSLGNHIEEAVGVGVFKKLYLVAGSKRRAEGTEVFSSKFATRDCQPIKYLPWEKEIPKPVRQVAETTVSSQPTPVEPEVEPAPEIDEPLRDTPAKPFPGPPKIGHGPSWIVIAVALIAMSGVTIVVGSYIGYQVAKIRRDRRRQERRIKKKGRRSGLERRLAQGPLPEEGERRSGQDRRSGLDRREMEKERRAHRDRRDEEMERRNREAEAETEKPDPEPSS